jgi:hypothetical protein
VQNFKSLILIVTILSTSGANAIPVDWKGSLAFDTNIIKDFRRTADDCTDTLGECINNEESNARFQSMTVKLNPQFIVNDGVTIFSELSTGSVRTSNLGEDTTANSGGAYYAQSTSSSLDVNQLYAELYADTALYRVGRFAKHYGLGAVINSGKNANDKFYSGYEGFEMQLKLGNFHLTPMWAKLHTAADAKTPSGRYDAYETSVTALYDNPNKNLKVGVLYSQKEVQANSTLHNGTNSHNVTLIDVFMEQKFENFSVALEIPMLSGEVGGTYGTGDADFDTNAYILESVYKANNKWNIGLNAGIVKGDEGDSTSFEGMYLHPNYQVGEVMFKYNYRGFTDNTKNVYDSSIVNTTYAQLFAHYTKGEWTWKLSALWAKANQTAETGKKFYDHSRMAEVTATQDQSDDMGYELDVSFDYRWNPSVTYTGYLGYHFVGDYYAFSDSTEELDLNNVMASGMRLSVSF